MRPPRQRERAHPTDWLLLIAEATVGLIGLLLAAILVLMLAAAIVSPSASLDVAATGPAGRLTVQDAWARAATRSADGSGGTSAIYLQVRNPGGQPDRLLGVTSPVAATTEVHRSAIEDGVMQMRPAGPVDVPAGEAVTLQPGGLHIMLMGLQQDLVAGERVEVTLQFEHAGDITVDTEIRAPMQQAPMHGR
ncbi:MAG: copper chaperone PCu(A)C [Chloroflexota bacterium]